MAAVLPAQYYRLRRRPGDTRLFITRAGGTDAGYLAGVGLKRTHDEAPTLHLELEESPHHLCSDGIDASEYNIPVDQILVHDLRELGGTVKGHETPFTVLLSTLHGVRTWLSTDEPPPCGHEDVIDTTELGQADPHGLCFWCSTALVRHDGDWVPA